MVEKQLQREKTLNFIEEIASKYNLEKLSREIKKEDSLIFTKDVYISLENIIGVLADNKISPEEKKEKLKLVKNIYNTPIFGTGKQDVFLNKQLPDLKEIIEELVSYNKCFKMNIYNIVNTILAVVTGKVAGYDLKKLFYTAVLHVNDSIENAKKVDNPLLIIPIGAAGSGKSSLYRTMNNVLNLSCDNIRYLLFKEYGPCFQPWESTLSWWVVINNTDYYLKNGYNVFFNGVNTDIEYRTPITMEKKDTIYEGLDYRMKLIYFEPPVNLSSDELEDLKKIDLWQNKLEDINFDNFSPNVARVMELIRNNYNRTVDRYSKIESNEIKQDPYDIMYVVPPAVVKLFVEQSFDRPAINDLVVVPSKEIPDEAERERFYTNISKQILYNSHTN